MKTVDPALAALINSGIFQYAHLYTVTLFGSLGGTSVIRLTDAPIDVAFGSIAGTRPWLPSDLSGLLAWYSADSGVYHDAGVTLATNGQTVQQWNDRSVHGYNLSLSGTGVTYNTTGLGGLKTINFVATGGLTTAVSAVSLGGTTASAFATADMAASNNSRVVSFTATGDGTDFSTTASVIFMISQGPTSIYAYRQPGGAFPGPTIAVSTIYRFGSVFDGANNTFYLNNAASTPGASTASFGATGRINVGMNTSADGQWNGQISEVVVTNTAVSSADRSKIDQYLAFKWQGIGSAPTVPITTPIVYNANMVDQRANKRLAHWKRGLDVDQAVVVLAPRTTDPISGAAFPDKIGSVPFIEAARGGALDGADIQIDRVFFTPTASGGWPQPYTTPITPLGAITIFAGTPAEVDTNDSQVVLTVNDYRQLLQNKFPRNVYQLACSHTLFDAGCAITPAAFSVAGIVCASNSTRQIIIANADVTPPVSPGSGTFTLGKVTFTSGLNSGFSRTVRQWTAPRTFALLNPLPFAVAPGDTFTAVEGCDKQQTTCAAFANAVNFGGEPFVPDATHAA